MPLLIPAHRDLAREGLSSFVMGLQEQRIRDEQQRRAEEAADAGSGALGAGLGGAAGMIAGIALAPVTGGMSAAEAASMTASYAAIGGGIGSALGGVAGEAIDPAGSNYGGSGQVVGQYLQAGTQQVQQGLNMRASASKAGEATDALNRRLSLAEQREQRLEDAVLEPGTPEQLGITKSVVDAYMDSPAGEAVTRQQASQIIGVRNIRRAAKIQRDAQTQIAGQMEQEARTKLLEDYEGSPEDFIHSPDQEERRVQLDRQETSVRDAMLDSEITPSEGLQTIEGIHQKRGLLSREVKRRPKKRMSLVDALAAHPDAHFDTDDPRTATEVTVMDWDHPARSYTKAVNKKPEVPFEFPEGRSLQESFVENGYVHRYEKDRDGNIVMKTVGKHEDGTVSLEMVKQAREQAVQFFAKVGGDEPTDEAIEEKKYQILKGHQDTVRRLERDDIVAKSQSAEELITHVAEGDPQFKEAMQVIRRSHQASVEQVAEAVKHIGLTLGQMIEGTELPLSLDADLRALKRDLQAVLDARREGDVLGAGPVPQPFGVARDTIPQ